MSSSRSRSGGSKKNKKKSPRPSKQTVKATDVVARMESIANGEQAVFAQRFFRTGPGDYGEGDLFLGIRVPDIRKLARDFRDISVEEIEALLASKWHEVRLLALVLLVNAYQRADAALRQRIFDAYMRNTARINNWDLVDVSAPQIVGAHLAKRGRSALRRLARSKSLWERRIAIVATQYFIRHGDLEDAFAIAEILLRDKHDLIHKASGWMLREAGKRNRDALIAFLEKHAATMPRTMLRYAIEHFPAPLRSRFMAQA